MRKARTKKFGRHDGPDVEHDPHQQEHGPHARQGGYKSFDHAAQGWHNRNNAQDPQYAQGAQDGQAAIAGHQRHADNDEIEDVPAIAEEAQALGKQLGRKFNDKDCQTDAIKQKDQWPRYGHDRLRCLHAKDDGIEYDHSDDEIAHPCGLKQCGGFLTK